MNTPTLFGDPEHVAVAYPLERLWGLDRSVDGSGWWAWRCTCGRDVGAEQKCAYSGEDSAQHMANHHMYDNEPWAHPEPGWPPGYTPRDPVIRAKKRPWKRRTP